MPQNPRQSSLPLLPINLFVSSLQTVFCEAGIVVLQRFLIILRNDRAESGRKSKLGIVSIPAAEATYHVLGALVLILKQFLAERNFGISYTGGLSSYGVTLMAVPC